MNDLEFLRDAADRDVLYPVFAGMVQAVFRAKEMSDHVKAQRLRELSTALNQVIDAQYTSCERSGEYARV